MTHHDDDMSKSEQLLARVLAKAADDELRALIGEAVRGALGSWNASSIVSVAMEPIVKAIVAEEICKPEMQEQIRLAVRGSLAASLPKLKVQIGGY